MGEAGEWSPRRELVRWTIPGNSESVSFVRRVYQALTIHIDGRRDRYSHLSRNLHRISRSDWFRKCVSTSPSCSHFSPAFPRSCADAAINAATPDYISSLKSDPSIYPRLLRNLQYIAIAVNAPLLLVVFAVLPINSITSSTNSILNLLASTSSKSLAILITIDAVLILSAGVMTGIISAIALVEQMIEGQILPKFLGWKVRGGAIWMSLIGFVGVCVAIWASSGFDLGIVSQMYVFVDFRILLLPTQSSQVRHHIPRSTSTLSHLAPATSHQPARTLTTQFVLFVPSTDPPHHRSVDYPSRR